VKFLGSTKNPNREKGDPGKRNLKVGQRSLDKLFNKGRNFLEGLRPDDNIALIYHMDMDGVCSAALIHIGLKKLSGKAGAEIKISKSIVSTYGDIEGVIKTLGDFNKIIIVDIGIDQDIEKSFSGKMLLIDHHMIKRDTNSDSVVFINPRFENPETYQPASYVVYKLLSGLMDIKRSGWISAIGIIGDWGYEDCRDVIDDWVEVKRKEELFGTKLGQIGNMLLGASYELGFNYILDNLVKAKSQEDLEKDEKIRGAYKKYELAFEAGKKEFWDNAEKIGNIIFSEITPRYRRLGSPIENRVSFETPDKIIFLIERGDGKCKVGARYQQASKESKVHLGELMKRCCGGGGHRQAAGGDVKTEDIEKFKKCVIKELEGLS
jgi:hypothetical protein